MKIRGTGKNSNMRGIQDFLRGLKNRGGKAFSKPVTEGCFNEGQLRVDNKEKIDTFCNTVVISSLQRNIWSRILLSI